MRLFVRAFTWAVVVACSSFTTAARAQPSLTLTGASYRFNDPVDLSRFTVTTNTVSPTSAGLALHGDFPTTDSAWQSQTGTQQFWIRFFGTASDVPAHSACPLAIDLFVESTDAAVGSVGYAGYLGFTGSAYEPAGMMTPVAGGWAFQRSFQPLYEATTTPVSSMPWSVVLEFGWAPQSPGSTITVHVNSLSIAIPNGPTAAVIVPVMCMACRRRRPRRL